MTRKSLAAAMAATTALAGCIPTRSDLRQKAGEVTATVFQAKADRPGRLVEPQYCQLDTAILSRPSGDPIVATAAWNVADEQVLPIEARQVLEANGLRLGVITGALPGSIVEAFKPKPPIEATRWVHVALPEGEPAPVALGGKTESVSLLLNHRGRVDGRDYHDAAARLVLTPGHDGLNGVSIRVVPEIHHGSERRTIAPIATAAPFAQREFGIKDGQQEDILRELATSVALQPGQTLVIGCREVQGRSLGTFLFLQPDPKGGQTNQSILLVQAARNNPGVPPLKPIEDDSIADDQVVRAGHESTRAGRRAR